MAQTKKQFNNPLSAIDDKELYSLLLFVLFKLKDDEKYSSLSQLMFVLNKSSVLDLFEYFGGMTITIPTIEDLELILYCLLVYKAVHIDGKEFSSATKLLDSKNKKLDHHKFTLSEVKKAYKVLEEVMKDYNFNVPMD